MKKNIKALSFTPKYDELEDRIRISINYDDIQNRVDFMMTRSFVIKLFPILDEFMSEFYNLDLTLPTIANQPAKVKIKEDKSTSITDGTNLELYHLKDELLVEIKFSYIKSSKMSIVKFQSKDSEAVAQLDANSMKQIFTIIKSTIPFYSWGISHNI